MKRISLALTLLPLLTGAAPWPQKGSLIFIRANVDSISITRIKGGFTRDERRVPACTPWTVLGAIDDPAAAMRGEQVRLLKLRSTTADKLCLRGDWSKAAFRSADECSKAIDLGTLLVEDSECYSVTLAEDGSRGWIHN